VLASAQLGRPEVRIMRAGVDQAGPPAVCRARGARPHAGAGLQHGDDDAAAAGRQGAAGRQRHRGQAHGRLPLRGHPETCLATASRREAQQVLDCYGDAPRPPSRPAWTPWPLSSASAWRTWKGRRDS